MKHFILVLSIIFFVSLPFLHPSIIEDASFNDYNYLRNLRRSDNRIDNEYSQKKLYDTTFTDQGKIPSSTGSISPIYNTITPVKTNIQTTNSTGSTGLNDPSPNQTNSNQTNQTNINLLPYLLLLLIIVVIIILYMKYKIN